MKRITQFVAVTVAILVLAGCLDNAFKNGSAADPPTNVRVSAGDSSATITWTGSPSVQYWLFSAIADSVSPDNWDKLLGGRALVNVSSPLLVTGLSNGATYSFSLNARTNNGPGGLGTASISAVPRLAGGSWTIASPLANDLHGVAFGTLLVAVGAHGALYSSPDFNSWTPPTWTARTSPLAASPDLNAVAYGGGLYVAVGAAGSIITSPDAVTWTARDSTTTNALYGVASNGFGAFVAVGEKGTVLVSNGGATWTKANSGRTNDLFGVNYGGGLFVSVGANGTLLTSADVSTWTSVPLNTSLDMQDVAFGINPITGIYNYVAVGEAGTALTSTDGVNWIAQTPITTRNLNSVAYNKQFIIVGDGGTVITSDYGTTMQLQNSGTSSDLTALTHNYYGLSAVGLAGTTLSSF